MNPAAAGLADDQLDRDFQILDAAGDIGIARGAAGFPIVLVVHGPAVKAIARELVHCGIFALARHVEIEHPRCHRRTMDEEDDRPRRLAGLGRADPLAKHPQGNVALSGPVFVLQISPPSEGTTVAARAGIAIAAAPRPSPERTVRRATRFPKFVIALIPRSHFSSHLSDEASREHRFQRRDARPYANTITRASESVYLRNLYEILQP